MSLFSSIFGSRSKKEQSEPATEADKQPEISKDDFVDDSNPKDNVKYISCGTNLPIDAIYSFINKNYEEDGYDDAMGNFDCAYKDSKKLVMKNDLKRLFKQIRLRYKSDLRDLEVEISMVEEQGLINSAASLNARKETYLEHMTEMEQMETALDNDEEQMLSMVRSYERGFLKGLAAKSNTLLEYENA